MARRRRHRAADFHDRPARDRRRRGDARRATIATRDARVAQITGAVVAALARAAAARQAARSLSERDPPRLAAGRADGRRIVSRGPDRAAGLPPDAAGGARCRAQRRCRPASTTSLRSPTWSAPWGRRSNEGGDVDAQRKQPHRRDADARRSGCLSAARNRRSKRSRPRRPRR